MLNTQEKIRMEFSNESDSAWQMKENLCRVCLISEKENECIFTTDVPRESYGFTKLWECLQFYGGVQVKPGDGLPTKICYNCRRRMAYAHCFRMKCQESDEKLRFCKKSSSDINEFNNSIQPDNDSTSDAVKKPISRETQEPDENSASNKHQNIPKSILGTMTFEEFKKGFWMYQTLCMYRRLSQTRDDLKILEEKMQHDDNHVEHAATLNQASNDPEVLSCQQCDKRFSNLANFLEHQKLHESNREIESKICKICNRNFRKFGTMVRHLNIHKKENPEAVYRILKEIRSERKDKGSNFGDENNSEENSCEGLHNKQDENAEYSKNYNPILESMNVDSNTKINCEMSSSTGTDDVPEDQKIPSDDESAMELINSWIQEELESDTDSKDFYCEICDKSYTTQRSLDKHTSKMHERSKKNSKMRVNNEIRAESKSYRCLQCEKIFEKESKFQKHMKIHEREKDERDKDFKRFLCHICSKTFRQNTGLVFHMRTHTGYKPHVCKFCGRGFTSNSNCVNHERTHTGDRPFICQFCSAAFAKSCTLKAHITTHTGEANYHCKTCGKSFKRLKYLKEHKYTHTGEKPYVCKICGTAYSHSGSLFVHEKKCKAQQQPGYQDVTSDCASLPIECLDNVVDGNNILLQNMSNMIDENSRNFNLDPYLQCS